MKILSGFHWLMLALVGVSLSALAAEVYKKPETFLQEAFNQQVPEPGLVWLVGDTGKKVEAILGHPPDALRERYWAKQGRSAWILEEVGKSRPITVGVVIRKHRIERLDVLIYRESRGWEVRYPVFTDQFRQASLAENGKLDVTIDGITGATLSVNALTRLARVALYLDSQVSDS